MSRLSSRLNSVQTSGATALSPALDDVIAADETTARFASGAADRSPSIGIPLRITWEAAAYLVLILIAVISRFWDLGSRALHHDESLHAYYSWLFSEGKGYVHNPLMHGPLLFHLDALFFFLFGASDAVSRAPAALAGVAMVAVPYLLRDQKFLGRWGALSASVLLLLSPSILYYTRFIRHDPFTTLGIMILFAAIVRYIDRPQRRWLIIGGATIALMLANHEIIFALLAIFFGYLYTVMLVERLKAWWDDRRSAAMTIVAAHVVLIVGSLAVLKLSPVSAKDEILNIPWQGPTKQQQIDYYKMLASNQLVLGLLAVFALSLGLLIAGLLMARRSGFNDGQPASQLLGDAPDGSVAAAVRSAWRDSLGLGVSILICVFIFVALFTTLFTNLHGLATSTFATDGTLLYWLGQHDVRRGEQPWFYYLTLFPQYDFIGFLFGFGATIAIAGKAIGAAFKLWSPGPHLFFRGFLATWFVGIFIAESFAGEKMPWLVMHIAVPGCLLAAVVIGQFIERGVDLYRERSFTRVDFALFAGLLVIGASWLALAGKMTAGEIVTGPTGGLSRVPTDWAREYWWLLAIPPLVALAGVGVWLFWRGPQRTALMVAAALVIGLLSLQIHAGFRMTYLQGDVPVDMLIYTQTSPDVPMLVHDLGEMSALMNGDKSMEIMYDSKVAWPMQWYLRDFSGKRYTPAGLGAPPTSPVLIVSDELNSQFEPYLSGYTATDYVLRWWFPEDVYRGFAIAPEIPVGRSALTSADQGTGPLDILDSIVSTISGQTSAENQQELFRLLEYRDLPSPNGQYGFKVYIRNDLLPMFNSIRYGSD
jgi:predicted membrane-bound mannosyltransferase